MPNTNDVLSKETRKLRKKKILSENESDGSPPPGKSEKLSRRMSTRFSSLQVSKQSTDATTLPKSNDQKNNTYMDLDTSEDDGRYGNDAEPPGTPIPQSHHSQSTCSDSDDEGDSEEPMQTAVVTIHHDSVDEYDTDELLEQLDNLGPLRQKLDTRQRNQGRKNSNGKRSRSKHKAAPRRIQKVVRLPPPPPPPQYNRERALELHETYPDDYWRFHADNSSMIGDVNSTAQLEMIHHVKDQGPVLGMTLSKEGSLLATYCTLGNVKVWDIENKLRLLAKLRDESEPQIDEFYCGLFQDQYLLAGGKLKDRHRWSVEDEDCHILPCPIKIFDLASGEVVCKLEGHEEEVLCIKSVKFEKKNYYVSTSQDGYIIKWQMEDDWKTLIDATRMTDGITCMAFSISFLPNTGNKYFMGACDAHLRLYDFENAQLLQTFENLYTSYCDCGKFIKWLDEEYYLTEEMAPPSRIELDMNQGSSQGDESALVDIENDDPACGSASHAWLITRGAEMVDGNTISIPNSCTLHQLVYPAKTGGKFELKEVRRYDHVGYRANSWMVKISTNGRYLFAPTMEGQVFVFNLLTGQVTGILKSHDDVEVRDVILHPFAPLMFSCGDDGYVNVYTYTKVDDGDDNENDDDDDDDSSEDENDNISEDEDGNNDDNDIDRVKEDGVDKLKVNGGDHLIVSSVGDDADNLKTNGISKRKMNGVGKHSDDDADMPKETGVDRLKEGGIDKLKDDEIDSDDMKGE